MPRRPAAPAAPVVRIESLAHGGDGVAHLDGRVVFVAGGLPGDRVVLEVLQVKRRHALASVARLVEASPLRQAVRCPQRPACGGCPWHELQLSAQQRAKARIVVDALRRVGQLDLGPLAAAAGWAALPGDSGEAPAVRHAGPELGFRTRARLVLATSRGRTRAGYRQARSHRVVDVDACPILHPALGEPVQRALERARRDRWPDGELRVAAGVQPLRCAAVVRLRDDGGRADALLQGLLDSGFAGARLIVAPGDRVVAELGELELGGMIAPDVSGSPLGHDPLTFAQPQLDGNRLLIDAVLEATAVGPGARVLELHAGAGNLSIPLAQRGARVRAVEVAPPALAWLDRNLRRVQLEGEVEVVAADVEEQPLEVLAGLSAVDVLLLDPPRTGFARLAELVRQCRPRRVVYVSCDPVTLARDVRPLLAQGYQPAGLTVIDLMPGSWHVESVLWLDCAT